MSKLRLGVLIVMTYACGTALIPLNILIKDWFGLSLNIFSTAVGNWLIFRGRWVHGP